MSLFTVRIDNTKVELFCVEILNQLEEQRKTLLFITQNQKTIMDKQERFDAMLTRMNDVTNNIAEDFKLFIDEAKQGTVSDESLAKAEANVTTLEQLAASKENPVPVTAPEATADDTAGAEETV